MEVRSGIPVHFTSEVLILIIMEDTHGELRHISP